MKFPNDKRVWLDKKQSMLYGAFPDQQFYAVQYEGENQQRLLQFSEQVQRYHEWCREAYQAIQEGREAPQLPLFLRNVRQEQQTEVPEDAPAKEESTPKEKPSKARSKATRKA